MWRSKVEVMIWARKAYNEPGLRMRLMCYNKFPWGLGVPFRRSTRDMEARQEGLCWLQL